MKRLLILLLLAFPIAVWAQGTEERDRDFITRLLEDNLSGDAREVIIEGFQGALSSRASFERLTIADDEGIWLTVEGAVFDWNRTALLRGAIDVNELSVERVLLPRLPQSDPAPPSPEASGFALPDLPISIDIERIAMGTLDLGAPVIGEAAVATAEGSASLGSGAFQSKLDITRTDGPRGAFVIDLGFEDTAQILRTQIQLSEGEGGLVARLLDLPGLPSVDFSLAGDAPIDDFTAEIALLTDEVPRLQGRVGTRLTQAEAPRSFALDLTGDLSPLAPPTYAAFLGTDVSLQAAGQRLPNGVTTLQSFDLTTEALELAGAGEIDARGWPLRLDVEGQIGDGVSPVVLPSESGEIRAGLVRLDINYNRRRGDSFFGTITLSDLAQGEFALGTARLSTSGTIAPSDTLSPGAVAARVRFETDGLDTGIPGLTPLVGPTPRGSTDVAWTQGDALTLSGLQLEIAAARAAGEVALDGTQINAALQLDVPDLTLAQDLSGLPLAGAATLTATGGGDLIGGQFDIRLEGGSDGLAIGQELLDPLIGGDGVVRVGLRRDETGTWLDEAVVRTSTAAIEADGGLQTGASDLKLTAVVPDLSVLDRGLEGATNLDIRAVQADDTWDVAVTGTAPGSFELDVEAKVDTSDTTFSATTLLEGADIDPYGALIGRPLKGGLKGRATASGRFDGTRLDLAAKLQGDGLATTQPEIDLLLRGQSTIDLALQKDGNVVTLELLDLGSDTLTASLSGSLDTEIDLNASARLSDVGLYAPGISGPLTLEGRARGPLAGTLEVSAEGVGPGNTQIRLDGTAAADGSTANLSLDGTAPLGLANRLISPRRLDGTARFDLALNGTPGLDALSGTVTTQSARLSVPTFAIALTDLAADVSLQGATAAINVSAVPTSGGRVTLSGPLRLMPTPSGELRILLDNFGLSDPQLYETTLNGDLALTGDLTRSPTVAGRIALGETELRIPSTGFGGDGDLPGLRHIGEPSAVTSSRRRAGLIETASGGGASPNIGLDVTIDATNQIFLRGRGLDAELGGGLKITGTAANPTPIGAFELIRGRLDILGKRLEMPEGIAQLEGDLIPFVRLVAETEADDDTTVRIIVEGPADGPEISFTSDPELPEDEVLARLLFGQDLTSLSALQAAQLAAAVRTLAGRGGGGIIQSLRENTGLDDLDITSSEDGSAALRAGKYISDNIYTDVTISSDGTSEINLNLDISNNVTARGTVGADGDSRLGVFFERDY